MLDHDEFFDSIREELLGLGDVIGIKPSNEKRIAYGGAPPGLEVEIFGSTGKGLRLVVVGATPFEVARGLKKGS